MHSVHPQRIEQLRSGESGGGAVIYWMSRDQRVDDNWALLYAQKLALELRVPLTVVFCLQQKFLNGTTRQYSFMLKGLHEIELALGELNIGFTMLFGSAQETLSSYITKNKSSAVVCDFDPIRLKLVWQQGIAHTITAPFFRVDTHNIVPCRTASEKLEYGAYTIRPKINRLLSEFLTDIPPLVRHPFGDTGKPTTNWSALRTSLWLDSSVNEVPDIQPGKAAAQTALQTFIGERLSSYHILRNNPNIDGQSGLSPYLHFGQISAQRVALEIQSADAEPDGKNAFLEEVIIRRELSDNFCFYNPHYDSFDGFPAWAQQSLNEHRADKRDYLYTLQQFELAQTHDALWNAAQTEMVLTGKMHGYMRMYWAKKILEWTKTPEEAIVNAIYLNDKYELDGRDTNGFAGIAWSIGGVHDRAWFERPVFGKIRYMNANGCASKFNVKQYIARFLG